MLKKFSSDSNPPDWEQPYLQKPELPDWKDFVLSAEIKDTGDNEFEVLFESTNTDLFQREAVTDRASFMKKDDAKIAQEIRSRLDRALKDFKYQIIEATEEGDTIEASVKLTSKTNNPKTIVASFLFKVVNPELFNIRASAQKVEARQTFACMGNEYPINSHGFQLAFSNHGVKYADSHIITTLYQLEETYDGDDVINGINNGQIVALNDKVYICEGSYLNSLKVTSKEVSIDKSFATNRRVEEDSDSLMRLQNIEKVVIESNEIPQVDYGFYTEAGILNEIKTNLGLIGEEASSLIQAGINQGLLVSTVGGFITEGKFSQKVQELGLASANKLDDVLKYTSSSHMTSKIEGEFRNEAENQLNIPSLLVTAKSKVDGRNQIVSHEVTSSDKELVITLNTLRKVSSYEIPVNYYFCFKKDGILKGAHASVAGRNCELNKLPNFYSALEKECLKRSASENLHADHQQELSPLLRNESFITDDSRKPTPVVDTSRFASVKDNLSDMVKQAYNANLLTEEDVEIFASKIDSAKQVSELTQIEREFKILTDSWSI